MFFWVGQITCSCQRIKFTTALILTRCVSRSFYRHYKIPSIHSCSHLLQHIYFLSTMLGLRTNITLWLWAQIWPLSRSWEAKQQVSLLAILLFLMEQCLPTSFGSTFSYVGHVSWFLFSLWNLAANIFTRENAFELCNPAGGRPLKSTLLWGQASLVSTLAFHA